MNTKALRQKILDLAIHGKLVPQDPNDEPASVLLERIRAEKERLIKEGKIKKPKKTKATCDKPHYPYQLPEGWVWTTVREICATFSTGPFGSMVHKSDYVAANGTPIINPANIKEGDIIDEGIKQVSKEKAEELKRYKLSENDILLARRGDLTKCAIVSQRHINNICGTGSFFLHLILVSAQFFRFVYSSDYVQNILKKDCVGATMDNLNQSVLANIFFPVPPLTEQMLIVKSLKYYLSLLDAIENDNEALQTVINLTKSKILDLAIHGKLVPQDPNEEPAAELLKRINPKVEISCDNPRYGKLPFEIPLTWKWIKLSDIANSNIGLTYRPTDIVSAGVPVYRSNNIKNGKINTTDLVRVSTKILEKQFLHVGDLLICARNGSRNLVGKNAIIEELKEPTSFGAFMTVCRSKYNQWIRVVLNSEYFDRYLDNSNSATINQITQKMLLALLVPLPPLSEQHRIVAKIEKLFSQLDKIKASL